MEEDLISVIIPIYKVERFLRRCLDSVVSQSYSNLQVILVDDGSPDRCPQICDEYVAKDNRFQVIHKKNGGVANSRNVGLDHAKGKYFTFIDSDDWLPKNAIEVLYERMSETDADLICGNQTWIYASGTQPKHCYKNVCYDLINKSDLAEFVGKKIFYMVYANLYKTDLANQFSVRFDEAMRSSDDLYFFVKYLAICKTAASVDAYVYYYNRLITGTLSKKYHPGSYKWMATFQKERISLFKVTPPPRATHIGANCRSHYVHMGIEI